ncbi:MAG: RhuM family protein [Herbiconiux sp.]|nr:RhuM family protein [Herbiconiux sp.]
MADGEAILYRGPDGRTRLSLHAVDGTVWLTQRQIADLYGTSVPNVTQTISRILDDGEVDSSTVNSELVVRREGEREVRRRLRVYNLEMILAVGYRATSELAVHFRQWASTVLQEYLVKGFALNDEQLKGVDHVDHFDELLERIRDIRASEKRFYQKVRDVFAQTSSDYEPSSTVAKEFFATIQNTLLFAVTGHTAAELVLQRLRGDAPDAGLTSWPGAIVRKADVVVAKNYLTDSEMSDLNLLTTMFLDFAESRTRRREQITMADWVVQTRRFVAFNEHPVLEGSGSVSRAWMESVAADRYEDFDARRRHAIREQAEAEHLAEVERAVRELGHRAG